MRRSTEVLEVDCERNHKAFRLGMAGREFTLHTAIEADHRVSSKNLPWLRKAAVAIAVGALCMIATACAPMLPANQSQADMANAIGMSAGSSHLAATGE